MTDEIEKTLEWIGVTDPTNISNIRENFTKKAGERAAIIKKQKDQSDTIIREAAPGALKVEKD